MLTIKERRIAAAAARKWPKGHGGHWDCVVERKTLY